MLSNGLKGMKDIYLIGVQKNLIEEIKDKYLKR